MIFVDISLIVCTPYYKPDPPLSHDIERLSNFGTALGHKTVLQTARYVHTPLYAVDYEYKLIVYIVTMNLLTFVGLNVDIALRERAKARYSPSYGQGRFRRRFY